MGSEASIITLANPDDARIFSVGQAFSTRDLPWYRRLWVWIRYGTMYVKSIDHEAGTITVDWR